MIKKEAIDLHCPCCNSDFQSTILNYPSTPGPTTTDFFTMSAGEQSIHYQVHTCLNCGFSFKDLEEGEIKKEVRSFVRQVITDQLPKDGEVPSWKKYEFLALIDESLRAGHYSVGMLYLHAAWCCYDLNEIELEKHYRKMAIEYFIMVTGSKTVDQDLVYLVPYLLGEQYRRIKEENEAVRWFDLVLEMDQGHPDKDFFVTLAAQQKLDPKEFMGEIIHEEQ